MAKEKGLLGKAVDKVKDAFDPTQPSKIYGPEGSGKKTHRIVDTKGNVIQEAKSAEENQPAPEQPTNAPLGATWQERIKNATASDDDMRTAYEAYQRGEYTPGEKTIAEWKKMGLMPASNEPAPNAEAPVETQPDAANAEQAAPEQPEQAVEATAEEPDVQEATEQVQEEFQEKTDEELEAYVADVEKSLNANTDAKSKISGIFQAYENGDIDKNQRNYFLADAIARFAKNIGDIQETKNQNALWANIESGNQKSAELDLGPNEWQQSLKNNWAAAQKLKNEAKSKQVMETLQTDLDLARQMKMDKYLYNDLPTLAKNYAWQKMDQNDRAVFTQMIAANKGAPLNADQLGNVLDPVGNAALGNALGDQQLAGAILGNNLQNAELVAKQITNRVQERFAEKMAELEFASAEEAVKALKKDNELKDLLNAAQSLDNQLKSATFDSSVRKAKGEAVNALYGGAVVELNIAGQKVTLPVTALVNGTDEVIGTINKAMGK